MREATKAVVDFKEFIQSNRDKIYSNTPKQTTISKSDKWFAEDVWDEIYKKTELKEK